MKKQRRVSIITVIGCLLVLLISACSDDIDDDNNSADNDGYNTSDYASADPIDGDTHIEEALAEALGKAPGNKITSDELATLTRFTLPPARWGTLARFVGGQDIRLLAHCINLKELDLSGHGILNFSPLTGLIHLERLNLSHTLISDLEPLTELANLQTLNLSWNQLNDLTTLAGMIQLKELNLRGNQIRDIMPLAGMIQLKELYLQHNQIHDITPLAHLTQIEKFYLHNNMIVDLKPLVDNPGLVNKNPVHLEGGFEWRADVVTVRDNPLSDVSRNVYIPALEARGVIVRH